MLRDDKPATGYPNFTALPRPLEGRGATLYAMRP